MIRSPPDTPQRVLSFSSRNDNPHRIDRLLQVQQDTDPTNNPRVVVEQTEQQQIQGQQQQETEQEVRQFREHNGLCLSCGQQLYRILPVKKSSVMGARGLLLKKRLPLHKLNCSLSQRSSKEEENELPPISNTRAIEKKPLTISGQVERGQCLNCCRSTPMLETTIESSIIDLGMSASPPNQQKQHGELQQQAIYKGTFNVYGERDGKGTMTWENGDAYTGDFFNGNRHGHGTLQFADGSEYVGEWECNQQHGVGTRCWLNGDCYTGQYSRGQRTGEGRFYFANGDLYVGGWQGNILHGLGRYYYSNGQRFEGSFVAGQRQGKGKLQRRDGSLDICVYSSDKRCGKEGFLNRKLNRCEFR